MKPTPLAATAVALLLFGTVLGGCSRKPASGDGSAVEPAARPTKPATAATSHLPAGIAWFDGDVDAAFATAKTANKPLFLYWGAEWCPPCAQIKATIFNRREFQERSRMFLPVYLDGDTPGAQKQGEKFGVIGYPTMILFRPDGTEMITLRSKRPLSTLRVQPCKAASKGTRTGQRDPVFIDGCR